MVSRNKFAQVAALAALLVSLVGRRLFGARRADAIRWPDADPDAAAAPDRVRGAGSFPRRRAALCRGAEGPAGARRDRHGRPARRCRCPTRRADRRRRIDPPRRAVRAARHRARQEPRAAVPDDRDLLRGGERARRRPGRGGAGDPEPRPPSRPFPARSAASSIRGRKSAAASSASPATARWRGCRCAAAWDRARRAAARALAGYVFAPRRAWRRIITPTPSRRRGTAAW